MRSGKAAGDHIGLGVFRTLRRFETFARSWENVWWKEATAYVYSRAVATTTPARKEGIGGRACMHSAKYLER